MYEVHRKFSKQSLDVFFQLVKHFKYYLQMKFCNVQGTIAIAPGSRPNQSSKKTCKNSSENHNK